MAFGLVILFILAVAFLPEKTRLFLWVVITFLIGLFAFIYSERFFYALPLKEVDLFIWSRLLLLIPTLLIAYVVHKFGERVFFYVKKPIKKVDGTIKLIIAIEIVFLLISGILNIENTPASLLVKAFLFAIIHSFVVELLWRGVLLYRMEFMLGRGLAIFFTSLSSALAYHMFGYSLLISALSFFLFLFLGTITTKGESIWPAVIIHSVTTLILIVFNVIPILGMFN